MANSLDFSAHVSEQLRKLDDAVEAVFRASVQELIELAQSYCPVDTSYLVNSMEMSLTEMPQVDPEKRGDGGEVEQATISASIIGDGFGATVYVGWTAAYAARIEFGFTGEDSLGRTFKQPAQGFVRRAVEEWPAIVKRNEERLITGLPAS